MNKYTCAITLALLLASPGGLLGEEELPKVKVHHVGDLAYVSGGIDPLERKALAKMAERYQVQLTFSREGSSEKLKGREGHFDRL